MVSKPVTFNVLLLPVLRKVILLELLRLTHVRSKLTLSATSQSVKAPISNTPYTRWSSSLCGSGYYYDIAVAESLFATLKTELMKGAVFDDRNQTEHAIFEYVEMLFNRIRRHSTPGYMSPVEFENESINT